MTTPEQRITWALLLGKIDKAIRQERKRRRDLVISKPKFYEERLPDGAWARYFHFRVIPDNTQLMKNIDIKVEAFEHGYSHLEEVVGAAIDAALVREEAEDSTPQSNDFS